MNLETSDAVIGRATRLLPSIHARPRRRKAAGLKRARADSPCLEEWSDPRSPQNALKQELPSADEHEQSGRIGFTEAYLMGYWDGVHGRSGDDDLGQLIVGLLTGAAGVAMAWWVLG